MKKAIRNLTIEVKQTGYIVYMEPLVGIVVPVFNTEKYLKECLDSIKNQTYQNFVCVIVDDGSTDNSLQIAKTYENIDEGENKKFLIYSKSNVGVSSARNYALNVIRLLKHHPVFICFVDSDDIVKPQFIEEFIYNLKQTQADYAVCGYDAFDRSGIVERKVRKTIKQELDSQEILEHFFAVKRFSYGRGTKNRYYDSTYTWALFNKCFRYELIKDVRFDESLKNCEDMKFFLNVSSNLRKGILLDKNLYLYRLRKGSLVHKKERELEMQQTNYNVLKDALQQKNISNNVKNILTLTMCRVCFDCFYKSVQHNNFSFARTSFCEIKKYIKLAEKKDIQGELKRKVGRIKFGFKINLLYAEFKSIKKKSKENEKGQLFYF